MTARLPQPESSCEDLEWVAAPRPGWRLTTRGKRCRMLLGNPRRTCGQPSVAEINRGYRDGESWWAYCPAHLRKYGDWIEDGQVMCWVLRKIGSAP